MSDIPYDKLGIPSFLEKNCDPASPKPMRLATAKGLLPMAAEALLGLVCVLCNDPDAEVKEAARGTLKTLPNVVSLLGQRSHPKLLELLAQLRPEPALDERIMTIRNSNDRTCLLIAERADSRLCEIIAANHERLLITPDILIKLYHNRACTEANFERANAFLRMEDCAPDLPGNRSDYLSGKSPEAAAPPTPVVPAGSRLTPKAPSPVAAPPPPEPVFDLEAEIEAALSGKASPMLVARQKLEMFDLQRHAPVDEGPLANFNFDFKDDGEFSLELTQETKESVDEEVKLSIAKQISMLTPGKKIKLAYVGNKEVRGLLIRDRNKQVGLAVVKSGRMSDAEALAYAGNRNLSSDVLREIGNNGEWMRKYPIKVALVNNPRTPPSISVGIVNQLQPKDLAVLSRNKNVTAVLFTMAAKLLKAKEH